MIAIIKWKINFYILGQKQIFCKYSISPMSNNFFLYYDHYIIIIEKYLGKILNFNSMSFMSIIDLHITVFEYI